MMVVSRMHRWSMSCCKPETAPLLVPIKREPCVIHETARGQFRRMFATENRADNVRRQYRETEEPRRVGRNDLD